MNYNYLASIINSTIRSTTPILLAALGSAICNQVGIFNLALEGQMLVATFVSIVVNYFTGSIILAVLAGVLSGALVGAIVAILQVKYRAADMVVGTSINLLILGLSSTLLFVFLGVKGSFSSPKLVALKKVNLPIIKSIPFLGRVFENLTILDYFAYIVAILVFIYLFKTVSGFRVLSIGVNREASESLGVNAIRTRMIIVTVSGALCGLGGAVLSMGQVILFTEGMTAGRGFIAMAAANMGQNHPLYLIISSLFFGAADSAGVALQNYIPSQLTMAIPYIATIVALAIFGARRIKKV